MLRKYVLILFLIAGLLSCGDSDPEPTVQTSEFSIFYGSFGGLCGYRDSLAILPNLNTYFDQFSIPVCDDIDYNTTSEINQTKYDNLFESFSLSDFERMSLNSCDRCLDGIDNFLNIQGPEFGHRIVFAREDNISDIQDLVDELNEIRDSHKPE